MAFSCSVPPLAAMFLAASSAAVYANAPGAATIIRAAAIRYMGSPHLLRAPYDAFISCGAPATAYLATTHSDNRPAQDSLVGKPTDPLTETAVGRFPRDFRNLRT